MRASLHACVRRIPVCFYLASSVLRPAHAAALQIAAREHRDRRVPGANDGRRLPVDRGKLCDFCTRDQ